MRAGSVSRSRSNQARRVRQGASRVNGSGCLATSPIRHELRGPPAGCESGFMRLRATADGEPLFVIVLDISRARDRSDVYNPNVSCTIAGVRPSSPDARSRAARESRWSRKVSPARASHRFNHAHSLHGDGYSRNRSSRARATTPLRSCREGSAAVPGRDARAHHQRRAKNGGLLRAKNVARIWLVPTNIGDRFHSFRLRRLAVSGEAASLRRGGSVGGHGR